MATPAKHNLSHYSGDNLAFTAEVFEDPDGTIPHNLSVYTEIELQVRPDRANKTGPPLISGKLSDNEIIVMGANNNEFEVDILGDKTELEAGKYEYDVEGSNVSKIQTLIEGRFTVSGDVVRNDP